MVVPRRITGDPGAEGKPRDMARDVLYLKVDHRNVANYTRAKM